MGFMDEYYKALQSDNAKNSSSGSGGGKSSSSSFMDEYNKAVGNTNKTSTKTNVFTKDIAPISDSVFTRMTGSRKKKKEEEKKKRKWFEKGLFEDGWDFGDITKTILGIDKKEEIDAPVAASYYPGSSEVMDFPTFTNGAGKARADFYADLSIDEIKANIDNAKDGDEKLKWTQAYNEKYFVENAKILSETKMDGTDRSILEEMSAISQMDKGEEKNKRKEAVLSKMESLGIDTADYAIYSGDKHFDWGNLKTWLGKSALSGLGSFNKGITGTADLLLGNPLKALGWENNPISKLAEHYSDEYDALKYDASLYTQKMGGGGGLDFASQAVEGTVGAIPNALLALMTAGGSVAASSSSLATTAAKETGNILTKVGLSAESMMRNPKYWLSFAQTLSGDYEQAKELGADDMTAAIGATINSLFNAGVEIGVDGASGIQGFTKDVPEGGIKKIYEWVKDTMHSEGGEEVIQDVISKSISKALYNDEVEVFNPSEMAQNYLLGATAGGLLGGGQVGIQSSVNAVQDYNAKKLNAREQAVVDKVVADRVAEAEKDGKKLSSSEKKKITETVVSEMERGYLSIDSIVEALGGEKYNQYKQAADWESSLQSEYDTLSKEYDELYNMKNGEKSSKQVDREAELKGMLPDLKKRLDTVKATSTVEQQKSQLYDDVFGLVKGDRLVESYNERTRRGQAFEADLTKYDAKQQSTIQKAIDSGILNNTNRTHEFVDIISKISADKGVLFDFTNNTKLKESGFAIDGKQVNGFVTKDGISINIDSPKAWQSTVGHEVTHVLEGTEVYTELQNTLFEYAKTKGDYDSRMQTLTELYKDVKDADINAELTADLVGEYLFTDENFIKNLSTQNRNVFQKIYDEIKYLYKVATGSKEAKELERVKRAFEKAYREGGKTQGETKYSMSATKSDNPNVAEVESYSDYGEGASIFRTGYLDSNPKMVEAIVNNREQTKSKEFGAWFGDSKAKNNSEEPLLVYHGTKSRFTEFKSDGKPIWFSPNVMYSRGGATQTSTGDKILPSGKVFGGANERVIPAYIKAENPADFGDTSLLFEDVATNIAQNLGIDEAALRNVWEKTGRNAELYKTVHSSEMVELLKQYGYDSIKAVEDGSPTWAVFESNQAKSAVANKGSFNISNPNIRYSLSKEGEQFGKTGQFATPATELRYNAPVAEESSVVAPVAENATTQPETQLTGKNSTVAPVKETLTTEQPTLTTGVDKADEALVTADDMSALFPNNAVPVQEELEQLVTERDQLYGALEIAVDRGSAAEVGKLAEEYEAINSRIKALESEETERTGSITDADAPAEMEAPYQPADEEYEGTPETVDDPFEERDWYKVGNQKVKAYMYENPEVKPFFQAEAQNLLGELSDTQKGERWYNDQLHYDSGGEKGFGGQKRLTSDSIATLLDDWGMSYADIEKGLNAIIEDNGAENIAAAKKIEFMLNDRLLNGYKDFYTNRRIEPNQDYVRLLNEKQISSYSREAFDQFMANADQYAPTQEEYYAPILNSDPRYEQTAPVYDLPGGQQTYAPTKATYDAMPTDDIAPTETALGSIEIPGQQTFNQHNATYDATPTDDVAPMFDATGKKGVPDGQQAFMPDAGVEVKQTRKEYHQSIIDRVKTIFKDKGFDFDKVLKNAKNLSTWSTVDNTPQRVMEKALGYKEGGILADITVNKVAQNETEGIKWLNAYVAQLKQISKQYGIKPGSKESAAAQMYAEGFYVNDNNEIVRYGYPELVQDFGDADVRRRIIGLARDARIRKIYDDTLGMINESRARNLYPEIPRLDNYFLHFRAMNDTFSTLGLPFNPNDIRAKDLPTDLNGVTADLKPGQPYFASANHRTGKRTSFDLLGGVERYLNSAKNQIYHIDDIQTLRALRNYIAETYGQATGLEDIDSMTDTEAEERIKQVYDSHLSTFAKFLNEEANVLAGKTALIDRGIEGIIGRRGITFLNALNKQVGSNMVGYNVSSSLTNFLPVVQTFAKTNKFDFTKAFAQTVANKLSGGRFDSFAEDSSVVIRRKGEDRFYRTPWQKMADPGYALMGMVDDISTEIIARTKYNEFIRKGMDSQKAHFETDKWVSKLMGDRSLGQQPQLYNSKMLGLVTKFQLEVRNQLDSQFYDTIQETKVSNEHIQNGLARNAKTAAKVASVFTQLAVAQHLYGMAFESMAGYNPAFDIIEVLMTAFGFDDEEDSEDTLKDNLGQGFEAFMEDLPYASIITGGGRIPISSALPIKEFFKGEDQYGNEKSRWETLGEVAPYYLMPGGYGQVKKTTQGLKMFSEDHPIAGSYTDAGNLRYDVEDTAGSRIKAGIFGQYASENAQKYFDQEQRTLNPEQTEIFAGLDMPIEEYWEYRDNLYEFYDVRDKLKDAAYADDATDEDVLRYTYINNIYGDIYDMYDQQKEIAATNSASKKAELKRLQKQMEQMLSESKYGVDSMKLSGAYAEVGGVRYNKDADSGRWYEIKPKNADGSDNWYYQKEQEVTKGLGISYEVYWNNREEYNFAYDKPGKYAIAQAVGGYDSYMVHYDALENWQSDSYIAADKDNQGNSISGSRKKKVQDYINGLDLDYGEKIILYRTVYSSKADKRAYNQDIIDYLNERDDISYQEMKTILEELEMEVDSEGYITW